MAAILDAILNFSKAQGWPKSTRRILNMDTWTTQNQEKKLTLTVTFPGSASFLPDCDCFCALTLSVENNECCTSRGDCGADCLNVRHSPRCSALSNSFTVSHLIILVLWNSSTVDCGVLEIWRSRGMHSWQPLTHSLTSERASDLCVHSATRTAVSSKPMNVGRRDGTHVR